MKKLLNGADSFLQVLGNARALVAVMFAVSALSLAGCSKDTEKEDKKDTKGTEAYAKKECEDKEDTHEVVKGDDDKYECKAKDAGSDAAEGTAKYLFKLKNKEISFGDVSADLKLSVDQVTDESGFELTATTDTATNTTTFTINQSNFDTLVKLLMDKGVDSKSVKGKITYGSAHADLQGKVLYTFLNGFEETDADLEQYFGKYLAKDATSELVVELEKIDVDAASRN